jgi:hypothetical protein
VILAAEALSSSKLAANEKIPNFKAIVGKIFHENLRRYLLSLAV